MLTPAQRQFLEARRVACLATADANGTPHVVPVCFALDKASVYIAIDEKPKRVSVQRLKRLRNIAANPRVALVADHYEDDWSQLGWVMLEGHADILAEGAEHAKALCRLRFRYPQLAAMNLAARPVIAIRVERVVAWGKLA